MFRSFLVLIILSPLLLQANDSSLIEKEKTVPLKGYRKLFYRFVSLHPKLNSPLEKELLQHYLAGSGATYIISTADFKRLQQTIPLFSSNDSCRLPDNLSSTYCYKQVDLNNDAYFGWGLGTITVVYNSSSKEIVSFIDKYDFNKKKKGLRSRQNEMVTGLFRMLAPKRARSFLVSFADDAYMIRP